MWISDKGYEKSAESIRGAGVVLVRQKDASFSMNSEIVVYFIIYVMSSASISDNEHHT